MKKLASALSVLAFLATMTFGFSSCQQQNQPEQPKSGETTKEEPSIVGEWKVLLEDMGNGEIYPGQGASYIFSKDNTVIMSSTNGIQKGTYTLIGKSIIFDFDGFTYKATIKKLTNDSLIFRVEMGEEGDYIEYTCQRV